MQATAECSLTASCTHSHCSYRRRRRQTCAWRLCSPRPLEYIFHLVVTLSSTVQWIYFSGIEFGIKDILGIVWRFLITSITQPEKTSVNLLYKDFIVITKNVSDRNALCCIQKSINSFSNCIMFLCSLSSRITGILLGPLCRFQDEWTRLHLSLVHSLIFQCLQRPCQSFKWAC